MNIWVWLCLLRHKQLKLQTLTHLQTFESGVDEDEDVENDDEDNGEGE